MPAMTTTTTWTPEAEERLTAYLANHHLPAGLGTKEKACSIAAVNLALTGTLTDVIPECMSLVVGRWIIRVQDAMPDDMRNSDAWKRALVGAAGSGRGHERVRADLILGWMWGTVLPVVQPAADAGGFGAEWATMCQERTTDAAKAAVDAATAYATDATTATDAATDAATAYAAYATTDATADAAKAAAYATAAAAAYAAYAAADNAATDATADAADNAYNAADNADAATAYAAGLHVVWSAFDPAGLLHQLNQASDPASRAASQEGPR